MILWKKLSYYTKNYGTLIHFGNIMELWKKNGATPKIWYYSKLQLTIVNYSLI